MEINQSDYYKLKDETGYYHYMTSNGNSIYRKDGRLHNINGPAYCSYDNSYKKYSLFGKLYGTHNDFTDESWVIFVKRILKLKAFI